jgi:hypothetical protein
MSSYLHAMRSSLTLRNFMRTKSTGDDGEDTPPGPASFSDTEPSVRDDGPLLGGESVNKTGPTSEELRHGGGLRRVLTLPDLLSYGVGSTVGAGIYTVVAVAAALSGYLHTNGCFRFSQLLILSAPPSRSLLLCAVWRVSARAWSMPSLLFAFPRRGAPTHLLTAVGERWWPGNPLLAFFSFLLLIFFSFRRGLLGGLSLWSTASLPPRPRAVSVATSTRWSARLAATIPSSSTASRRAQSSPLGLSSL